MYSITENGNVITHKRQRLDGRVYPEKVMKTQVSNVGYETVALQKQASYKRFYVHRLVALAFIPNPKNARTVNHIDGNKLNNSVTNLEWVSYSENIRHSFSVLKRVVWNKGRKGKQKNHNITGLLQGPWNKGKKTGLVPKTAFKKGHIPHNKPALENHLISVEELGK